MHAFKNIVFWTQSNFKITISGVSSGFRKKEIASRLHQDHTEKEVLLYQQSHLLK